MYVPYCLLFVSNSQVIGCEDRLRNDLYCVRWGVKLYSVQSMPDYGSRQNRCRISRVDLWRVCRGLKMRLYEYLHLLAVARCSVWLYLVCYTYLSFVWGRFKSSVVLKTECMHFLESRGKSTKLLPHFWSMYMFRNLVCIILVYCQNQFIMGQLHCHQIQWNYSYLKFLVNVTSSYMAQLCDFNGQP